MTELANPETGRTFRHERLLIFLGQMVADQRVQRALLLSDKVHVSAGEIAAMAEAVVDTASTKAPEGLTEGAVAHMVRVLLEDRLVRRQIARLVSESYGIDIRQAVRDLMWLRVETEAISEARKARVQVAQGTVVMQ